MSTIDTRKENHIGLKILGGAQILLGLTIAAYGYSEFEVDNQDAMIDTATKTILALIFGITGLKNFKS